jgi:hypothetical protein
MNFPTNFVEWMSTHILACNETPQAKKELVADRDLMVRFGQMKTSQFDVWDATVGIFLQAVQSSSCTGGCGGVYFAKLQIQQSKTEGTMHHYYSKVGVQLMQ